MKVPKHKVKLISFFDPQQFPHRTDFETCPHCDKVFDNEVWEEHRTATCLGIVHQKSDDGVIISECPKCFEKSWVHFHLACSYNLSDPEQEAAHRELNNRHIAAVRAISGTKCLSCIKLENLDISTKAWRRCDIGSGPPEKNCKSYKKVEAKSSVKKGGA